ncbi:diaminopimelate decarboxylase [Fibrobacter intestinalis]|uniref:Diaminopimelate decarboxylase n=1 Tax=Fibrobacter intestinalis TaxID=28122 RepID=A0A1M6Q040_9BACT|nr:MULTISPECIES: diaminopimelate decarboxylase [Fibrobacter]MDD7297928.1 diaminopimelate decarboxylase [Fibrobacter intestinalis]PBC68866.1 diaminopimelate decarboxylase [Fibrobacter sp. UWS1]SHK13605.1 diaminopimelate decarboxylase [Fibrobacter intestinalis]
MSDCLFSDKIIREGVANYGTPFWLYDQATIEKRVQELKCFDVVRFAQKACPNLSILSLIRKCGAVVDAVSAGEIVRALRAGFKGGESDKQVPQIVYTADIFDRDAIELVKKHKIHVNVGSADMIQQLADAGVRSNITLRLNPGFGHGHSQKTNTGGPLSKHGVWYSQIKDCLKLAQSNGMWITGLHMHIGSGSDFEHLSKVCDAMRDASRHLGSHLRVISAGGGLPIPYKETEKNNRIDVKAYYDLWNKTRKDIAQSIGHDLALEVEPGRYLVAESAVLVAEIRAVKKQADNLFYLVDAGFNDLVRPSFYGSYHAISIVSSDGRNLGEAQDAIVAGPLCESGDVFTQEEGGFVVSRKLPEAKVGDFLVLHDTGAYGSAMSSNYNSRRYAPEILFSNGELKLIRERQTFDQLMENEKIVTL